MLAFAAVRPRLVPPKTSTVAEAPEWDRLGGLSSLLPLNCVPLLPRRPSHQSRPLPGRKTKPNTITIRIIIVIKIIIS